MIKFGALEFEVLKGKIILKRCGDFVNTAGSPFVEAHIAGENKKSHMGAKLVASSEGSRFEYVSHVQYGNRLETVQKSEKLSAKTVFTALNGGTVFSAYTEVTNISDEVLFLEDVSSLVIGGIGINGMSDVEGLYFTSFVQSHHSECQPRRCSFEQQGWINGEGQMPSQRRIAFANVGSWSTKEALPQGIIEDTRHGFAAMFQIESNASWYYEISDFLKQMYLYLGGANSTFGSWCKPLAPNEKYTSVRVALSFGTNINEAVAGMTAYRRSIMPYSEEDGRLPTVFNEYMHLSWDSPTEENTRIYAPVVASTGIDYYVIDCGWHDEVAGNIIYPYVGAWRESKARFPHGVRATTDYIRSLGMKAGLWIEPEVVGVRCEEMLSYYTDGCFISRHGKKIAVNNRYMLDYRHPRVIEYMSETIRRMVEDYGADYIKFDCNQDLGVGTDIACSSFGEGLELSANAFISWVDSMRMRFPSVIFEGCASGGMRMDYKTLSGFHLMSTSDQTDYLKYPYIVGNVLSAVVPEQAAVWSYPVGECKCSSEISNDRIAVNMVNCMLGRMHLASHLEYMNKAQLSLVREGVEYYKTLNEFKKTAVPYFPCGFTSFGKEYVASGLIGNGKIALGVWCLGEKTHIEIPIAEGVTEAHIAYPSSSEASMLWNKNTVAVDFPRTSMAVFIEMECK